MAVPFWYIRSSFYDRIEHSTILFFQMEDEAFCQISLLWLFWEIVLTFVNWNGFFPIENAEWLYNLRCLTFPTSSIEKLEVMSGARIAIYRYIIIYFKVIFSRLQHHNYYWAGISSKCVNITFTISRKWAFYISLVLTCMLLQLKGYFRVDPLICMCNI